MIDRKYLRTFYILSTCRKPVVFEHYFLDNNAKPAYHEFNLTKLASQDNRRLNSSFVMVEPIFEVVSFTI